MAGFPFNGLSIFNANLQMANIWASACSNNPRPASVHLPVTTWSGSALTSFAGSPAPGNVITSANFAHGNDTQCGDADAWVAFNVTNTVRGWKDGTIPNTGLMLKAENESDPASWKKFVEGVRGWLRPLP